MLKTFLLGIIFLAQIYGVPALAKAQKRESSPASETKLSNNLLKTYRKAKLVELSVEKTLTSEWKASPQVYLGKMFYSRGKFRWENDLPEKNLTVYDGKILWNIQFSSPDFPGKNRVTKSKIDKKTRAQILLMSLIDAESLDEKFNIKVNNKSDEKMSLALNAKENDNSMKDIVLVLNLQKMTIDELSFKDDIGNVTKFKFSETKFQKATASKLFRFKPGKNDEVSEI